MSVQELVFKGFKSVVDQTIALGRVNCFIGANGSGKSNLLEALGTLSAAATGRVDDEAIIRRGVRAGLPRLFKTSFLDTRIPAHIHLEASGVPQATYRVTLLNPLDAPEPAWAFKTEQLTSGAAVHLTRGPRSRKIRNLDQTAGLAALMRVELGPEEPAAALLKTLQSFTIYSPNTSALRGIAPDPQMRAPVGLSGGGLADGFEMLTHKLDDELLDSVLELIDWVAEIGVTADASKLLSPSVSRSKQVLKFTDRFMKASRNTLSAYDASEGALYVLFAAVLCLSDASPSLFAIDNLDSALNPRLVTRLVGRLSGWLAHADPDRQLLFTAHNPAVLDGLDLNDDQVRLFAVERNSQGHTTVRRIEISDELRELNERYPLSRLWAMGNLGAVPSV